MKSPTVAPDQLNLVQIEFLKVSYPLNNIKHNLRTIDDLNNNHSLILEYFLRISWDEVNSRFVVFNYN